MGSLGATAGAGTVVSPSPQFIRAALNATANTPTGAGNNTTTLGKSQANIIYAWEEGNERPSRVPLEMGGVVFLPSRANGFYSRQDTISPGLDTTPLPEKYVDFQIILTEEELTTLAARKKTAMARLNVGAGAGGSTRNQASLNISTPYVDPRRIQKELLRPNNPDKWMDQEGLRPYKKGEKI